MKTEFIGNESTSCIQQSLHRKTKYTKFIGSLREKEQKILMEYENRIFWKRFFHYFYCITFKTFVARGGITSQNDFSIHTF